jgi:lipoprotein signal peptidase
MAIQIEQEKKKTNWFNLVLVALFIVVLFLVTYFIFFKKPELIDVVAPGSLQSISQISQIQLDPTPVVQTLNKYFTGNYGAALTIPTPGRSNPFAPY